jgi:hypothetical protein
MNTKTWTVTPADLLGLGRADVRRCTELDYRTRIGVSPAPRVAPFQGTGAPAGAVLAGTVPAGNAAFAHNSMSTILGIHPSGRPLS